MPLPHADLFHPGLRPVTRVLVIDDNETIRYWLPKWLRTCSGVQCVGVAGSLREARELLWGVGGEASALAHDRPDVLVLDFDLPGEDTIRFIHEVTLGSPSPEVLLYSGFLERHAIEEAMAAGARGFVSKGSQPEELLAAIHRTAGGHFTFTAEVLDMLAGSA